MCGSLFGLLFMVTWRGHNIILLQRQNDACYDLDFLVCHGGWRWRRAERHHMCVKGIEDTRASGPPTKACLRPSIQTVVASALRPRYTDILSRMRQEIVLRKRATCIHM